MVFVAKNGLRSDLRVYNFKKFSWWESALVPLADARYARTELDVPMLCPRNLLIPVTPLLDSIGPRSIHKLRIVMHPTLVIRLIKAQI